MPKREVDPCDDTRRLGRFFGPGSEERPRMPTKSSYIDTPRPINPGEIWSRPKDEPTENSSVENPVK